MQITREVTIKAREYKPKGGEVVFVVGPDTAEDLKANDMWNENAYIVAEKIKK